MKNKIETDNEKRGGLMLKKSLAEGHEKGGKIKEKRERKRE